MAEHAVSDVMNQRGRERDPSLRRTVVASALTEAALNRAKEKPCSVKNAEAVREPRVRRAGKDELAEPKLLYPAEPLKRACLDDLPERVFKLALIIIRRRTELD